MDRDRKDELPKMQVEFIDVVCKPLFTSLSESFPWIKPLLDGCLSNREKWSDLAEKVYNPTASRSRYRAILPSRNYFENFTTN